MIEKSFRLEIFNDFLLLLMHFSLSLSVYLSLSPFPFLYCVPLRTAVRIEVLPTIQIKKRKK